MIQPRGFSQQVSASLLEARVGDASAWDYRHKAGELGF